MATIPVAAGGNLQTAINSAVGGDIIELEAGATFQGNFTLPVHAGASYVTIRSAGTLPSSGTRVSPASAAAFAKIQAPSGGSPAIQVDASAQYWKLVGLEFLFNPGGFNEVISAGNGDQTVQTTLAQCPRYITVDRCYIHNSTGRDTQKRAIGLNCRDAEVINCYIKGVKYAGQDSQCVAAFNGPGPFLIDNNFLEGASENILLGGSDSASVSLMPADVTITNNYVTKDTSWRGTAWQVKTLFEIKAGVRVTVDSNIFEYCWADAQSAIAMQITVRNQDGAATWTEIRDVTITNNVIRHAGGGINFLGEDVRSDGSLVATQGLTNVTVQDNVFYDISTTWGGSARWLQFNHGGNNYTIDHNTCINTQGDGAVAIYFADGAVNGFVCTNNIFKDNGLGVFGTNGQSVGSATLASQAPGYAFSKNVMIGCPYPTLYPSGNFLPGSLTAVGFTDYPNDDYHLLSSSPYHNAATGGDDIGARFGTVVTPPVVLPGTVTTPSPANGATGVSRTPTLGWTAAASATTYDVKFGTSSSALSTVSTSQVGVTYAPSTLDYATTYYWQVVANNADGSTAGPVWSFTTLTAPTAPSTPGSPSPGNGSTGIAGTVILTWAATSGATSYDVAFGTSNAPSIVSTAQAGTSYDPPGTLTAGTTYYWRVIANNTTGSTSGPIWSFTIAPASPPPSPPGTVSNPSPANGATHVNIASDLTWLAASLATAYDVFIGTTNPPPMVSAAQTGTVYNATNDLTYSTTYYWRVTSKNNAGDTTGTVWSFTTDDAPLVLPGLPNSPSPGSASTDISLTPTLTWAVTSNTSTYSIAFGTSNPPSTVMTGLLTPSYTPAALALDTRYYWRVTSVNSQGSTVGPLWQFVTDFPEPSGGAPDTPTTPSPSNSQTGVSRTPTLTWAPSAGATGYDVAFGTSSPPPSVVTSQIGTSYTPSALVAGTRYYWRITAVDSGSMTTTPGPVWSFTTVGTDPAFATSTRPKQWKLHAVHIKVRKEDRS